MQRASPFWLTFFVVPALASQELSSGNLPSGPLPETASSGVEYPTVAAALSALRARKDVSISTERGWTIITDEKHFTIWSFAPSSYPAYPALVKRTVRDRAGGGSHIDTSVLCEAHKAACDQLVREFDAMNRRLPPARN